MLVWKGGRGNLVEGEKVSLESRAHSRVTSTCSKLSLKEMNNIKHRKFSISFVRYSHSQPRLKILKPSLAHLLIIVVFPNVLLDLSPKPILLSTPRTIPKLAIHNVEVAAVARLARQQACVVCKCAGSTLGHAETRVGELAGLAGLGSRGGEDAGWERKGGEDEDSSARFDRYVCDWGFGGVDCWSLCLN
jgi:hypothetical protein